MAHFKVRCQVKSSCGGPVPCCRSRGRAARNSAGKLPHCLNACQPTFWHCGNRQWYLSRLGLHRGGTTCKLSGGALPEQPCTAAAALCRGTCHRATEASRFELRAAIALVIVYLQV